MAEQNHLASTEWVDIVNENNEVIAQSSREQMRAAVPAPPGDPISSFMTEWGKFWCSDAPRQKDFHPGMLDATAGGVVQAD